jgi:hypothetical protein
MMAASPIPSIDNLVRDGIEIPYLIDINKVFGNK